MTRYIYKKYQPKISTGKIIREILERKNSSDYYPNTNNSYIILLRNHVYYKKMFDGSGYFDISKILSFDGSEAVRIYRNLGHEIRNKILGIPAVVDNNYFIFCPYCGVNPMSKSATIDHFVPQSVLAQLSAESLNLIPSCWPCNTKKRANWSSSSGIVGFHPYLEDFPDGSIILFFDFSKVHISSTKILYPKIVLKAVPMQNILIQKRTRFIINQFDLSRRYSETLVLKMYDLITLIRKMRHEGKNNSQIILKIYHYSKRQIQDDIDGYQTLLYPEFLFYSSLSRNFAEAYKFVMNY
ncbi:HNH endonuclease signature motif containing protein [Rothia endophytica]|uniref:HNH domain-containing protein n=1 Tax=Rothia endophytica TaxID=1324766 RepID=A0ABP9BAZ6_9MICC